MDSLYADAAAFGSFGFKTCEDLSKSTPECSNEPFVNLGQDQPIHTEERGPLVTEDFIIFAEFSEVTGPIPLLTIPAYIANVKDFDINDFILQIMSVDYQVNPSCNGRFQISEDVQVLLSAKDLHAYIHYTMLHDLLARGWVRPLCIAYVSPDADKMHMCFPIIRKMFLKMTQIMKYNNHMWFAQDLSQVIRNIKDTQDKYFSFKKREEDGVHLNSIERQKMETINMEEMVRQYTEYKNLLHCIEPLLGDEESSKVLGEWEKGLQQAESSIVHVATYLTRVQHERESIVECAIKVQNLRNIIALSPWGCALTIWILLKILHQFKGTFAKNMISHLETEEDPQSQIGFSVSEALLNVEFLQLLENMAYSSDKWTQNSCSDDYTALQDQVRFQTTCDVHKSSSGNEASSSYHSASESLSELPKDTDQSSDDSFIDISESFDSDSDSDNESAELGRNISVWRANESSISQPNISLKRRLFKFLKMFDKEACHLIYALLVGRTVVLSGGNKSKHAISRFITSLTCLVPVSEGFQVNSLPWHCGILVPSHISSHQLIGLCVPERLTVHDMISHKDKNSVTILDICSRQLFGPAYSGSFLSSMESVLPLLSDCQGLNLYLQSVVTMVKERLFVFMHAQRHLGDKTHHVLKQIKLHGCDAEIIKHFSNMVR